ncbi:MAG: site-2 protease family protein [Patescibacteria group bacterium]
MNQGLDIIFQVAMLIFSVIIHEISHGYAALALGDRTAKYAGRLTLNPLPHIDLFGSIILPIISFATGGFIFGWAKPVPYNPYNLRNQKWGSAIVGAAGPLSNLLIAFLFGTLIRVVPYFFSEPTQFLTNLISIASFIVFLNILLAIFNLLPIPPLDGSKVLFAMLPYQFRYIQEFLEQYGFIILLFFIFFLFRLLHPVIQIIFSIFTGIGF